MKTKNLIQKKDKHFLELAIRHGNRSKGITWPNPPVGCILVKDGIIVGRGSTGEKGVPHAEILALKSAGDLATNSDLYCSLEPCSHYGKTPPCSNEIIRKKISRVIIPMLDPNPIVMGKGMKLLEKAGIQVIIISELEQEAYELIKGFCYLTKLKRPFITLKIATSLDGMIATENGDSKWISNSLSRERVQHLRFKNDAILVGTNTVINDKPSLSVRNGLKVYGQPLKFFIDSNLRINPINLKSIPNYIFHRNNIDFKKKLKWENHKTTLIPIKYTNDKLNVEEIVQQLSKLEISNLLIEGGGKIAASFIESDLIDKVVHYNTGLILGSNGVPSISKIFKKYKNIKNFPRLDLKSVRNIGNDVETIWERVNSYL